MNVSSEDLSHERSNSLRTPTKKFKKKSEFDSKSKLKSILESKSRISINGSTGKYDFVYRNQFVTNEQGKIIIVPNKETGQKQKSDNQKTKSTKSPKVVNCLFDSEGKSLEDAVPMISRPSNWVWQLPYEDRKQFIEMDAA